MHRALTAFIVLLAVGLAAAASAQPPASAPAPAATLTPAEAQRIFTDLLQRFFDAYARKDIEGMTTLYHPGGPARFRRNVILVEFDLRAGRDRRADRAERRSGRRRRPRSRRRRPQGHRRRRRRRSGTSAESATSPSCRTTPAPGRSGTRSPRPASWRAGCSRHPRPSAMRSSRPSPSCRRTTR